MKILSTALLSLVFLISCVNMDSVDTSAKSLNNAVVRLHATEGNSVSGVIWFSKVVGGVKITGTIEGLPPGDHGFHIHQFGDCSFTDGKSAGGHFNPEGVDHGAPTDEIRHVGDLGNITSNFDSVAVFEFVDVAITLAGGNSILSRAVIIHAGSDDLNSQPTGAAGARLACGVIGIANK